MPRHEEKYLYDHPHQPGKLISRQRLHQIKLRDEGRCPSCGNKRKKKNGVIQPGLCTDCYPRRRAKKK